MHIAGPIFYRNTFLTIKNNTKNKIGRDFTVTDNERTLSAASALTIDRRQLLLGAGTVAAASVIPVAPAEAQRRATVPGRVPLVVAADADTGEILYSEFFYGECREAARLPNLDELLGNHEAAADVRVHIASVSKRMALHAIAEWIQEQAEQQTVSDDRRPADALLHPGLEQFSSILARTVPITARARATERVAFTHSFLRTPTAVESLTLDEAIRIVMLISANDVLEAINDMMGGTLPARMNAIASRLGLRDTHYFTCTGLPLREGGGRSDNYSTPRDQIMSEIAFADEHPAFLPYLSQLSFTPQRSELASRLIRRQTRYVPRRRRNGGYVRGRRGQILYRATTTTQPTDTIAPRAQYLDARAVSAGQFDISDLEVDVDGAALSDDAVARLPTDAELDPDDPASAPAATDSDNDEDDVPLGGLRYCTEVKSGYNDPGGRCLAPRFDKMENGVPLRIRIIQVGAENQDQRLRWTTSARDMAFLIQERNIRTRLAAERAARPAPAATSPFPTEGVGGPLLR
jgi:hypothetical protein